MQSISTYENHQLTKLLLFATIRHTLASLPSSVTVTQILAGLGSGIMLVSAYPLTQMLYHDLGY